MKRKYQYKQPNIFQRAFSFCGTMPRGEFWSEVGTRFISWFCALIMLCILVSVFVNADAAMLNLIMEIIAAVTLLIYAVSVIALSRRRLRDAGLGAKTYLWLLLPVIGWIVFIAKLCANSVDSKE